MSEPTQEPQAPEPTAEPGTEPTPEPTPEPGTEPEDGGDVDKEASHAADRERLAQEHE